MNLRRITSPTLILAGVLAVYVLLVISYYRFTIDDAYISFRYAENWARGLGLVFNRGEPVEGYTNFLWVILLGLLFRLHLPTVAVAKSLSAVFGLGTLYVTYEMGRLVTPGKSWAQYLAIGLLALYPGFAIWSASGLETIMFAFWIMLGLWFAVLPGPRWRLLSGGVFVLATLTRPEGLLLFGVTFLNGFIWLRIRRDESVSSLRYVLYNVVPYVVVVGVWEWWRWSFYGYPLPNPFYMKVVTVNFDPLSRGVWYAHGFFNTLGGWLALGLSLLIIATPSARRWKTLFVSVLLCWALFIWIANGDWMPWYRLFIPILPLIFLALQDTVAAIWDRMPQLGIALGAFLLLLGTLEAANILRTQAPIFGSHQVHQGGPGIDAVAAGQWLKTNADPRATVAVIGAGAIPYFSGLTALDYLGIVNPTVAHMPFHPVMLDLGDGTKQQDFVRLDVNWLLNQAPTYIEIMGSIRKDGSLATDTTIAQLVFESKRFQEEYGNEPVFVSGKEMLFEHR